MALGKRKRETTIVSRTQGEDDASSLSLEPAPPVDYQEALRRHFERQFAPLDVGHSRRQNRSPPPPENDDYDDENDYEKNPRPHEEDEEDNWSGLSDSIEDAAQVVDYSERNSVLELPDKRERKAFMTANPPSFSSDHRPPASTRSDANADKAALDADNLKNDVALQRLLRESHLLDDPSTSLNPTGKKRHRALDLRMQDLGARSSLFGQDKMPMVHRRGLLSTETRRENKRRNEARENGIVLERPTPKKGKKAKGERRERGIGGPAVGKFSGGTLRLSRRDVEAIQGPRRSVGGKGKQRR